MIKYDLFLLALLEVGLLEWWIETVGKDTTINLCDTLVRPSEVVYNGLPENVNIDNNSIDWLADRTEYYYQLHTRIS